MVDSIYSQLWNIDRTQGNGAKVLSVPAGDGAGIQADVLLDEQAKASGRRELDLATRPLFREVKADLLKRPTYAALRRLLDNYVVDYRATEVSTPEEEEEERAFVAAVCDTAVMDTAFAHVCSRLRPGLTKEAFREEVLRMWFTRYTNYYNGQSTHYCSGFEHVFVGEGKYQPRFGITETKGEISGYHSWIKFFLDEEAGRVNYLGHKYDLQGGQGPDDARVVTLQMIWTHQDFDGNLRAQLFKRQGGFFVGSSPEADIALGTVAFYESAAGLVNDDEIPTTLGDDGRQFRLVIYRNILQDGRRGTFIRSFFPKYLGAGPVAPIGTSTVIRMVQPERRNPGPIVIESAMPNPAGGGDEVGEWVSLRNDGPEVNLTGWELRDSLQRPHPLVGALASGETRQFDIVRRPNGMALGNKGGLISLHEPTGDLKAAVGYAKTKSGVAVSFSAPNKVSQPTEVGAKPVLEPA